MGFEELILKFGFYFVGSENLWCYKEVEVDNSGGDVGWRKLEEE